MRFSPTAIRWVGGAVEQSRAWRPSKGGAFTTVDELAALETAARDFSFLRRQPVHSLLSGRHGSRVRGRGLAFEELRQYLPGDDIRTMDWHVTARTGKPYIRVYTEEKDRPTIVVVDQRVNMFFGSVRSTKSVAAAEVAGLVAWRSFSEGDRVGSFVFGDERLDATRPQRSRGAVMRIARSIATLNGNLCAGGTEVRTPGQLNVVLGAVADIARHDNLVVIISDFDGNDAHTNDLLLRLAATNDVVAALIYDPFLMNLPPSGEIVVSDGDLQVELGLTDRDTRHSLADFADGRVKEIFAWCRELGVTVLPISAAEEVATQMRRLLGHAVGRGKGR